jgi:TatD DNase family protein
MERRKRSLRFLLRIVCADTTMLIDSHAHLESPEFRDDLDGVIARAREAGVEMIFTVGTETKDWARTLELARTLPSVYAILGIHPHNAMEVKENTWDTLRRLCRDPRVKALGEAGLDFYRDLSPRKVQLRRFREQVALARELRLPLVVHDRDAHAETLEVLREESAGEHGGIIHCFSGDYAMARACLDRGFLISIPGTVTFRNAEAFRDVVARLPLEGLLVETDAPYLAPMPLRGKRNEPALVVHTARKVAEVKGVPFEKVAEVTTANAMTLFGVSLSSSEEASKNGTAGPDKHEGSSGSVSPGLLQRRQGR